MLRVGAIATGRRTLAIGCLIAWSAIAWSCKSDPAPAERTSDDPPIVAARIDRARVARNNASVEASVEPRPALPPHPTDPVEPIESDVATPSTVASADAAAQREASGDASSGSSSASGDGQGGGSGTEASSSGADGEGGGSEGSPGASAGASSSGSEGSSQGVPSATRSPTAAQVQVNQSGASSGSGSNAGAQGSGSGSESGADGPTAEGAAQTASSNSGARTESAASGSQSPSGEGNEGSAESSASSGAMTEAGGAGSGGGIGEQGAVDRSSSDHVQPESGAGGTQGGSNTTPGPPPTWIEPTAMEGSEAGGAAGGTGGTGSGEARSNESSSARGGGGAQAGGLGEGRATESPEPAAPAGSLGVAQASDASEVREEEDFLDAPLEVRDFPTVEAKPAADPAAPREALSGEVPRDATTPEGVASASAHAAESSTTEPQAAIDADARESVAEGSIESESPSREPRPVSGESEGEGGAASRDRAGQGAAVDAVAGEARPVAGDSDSAASASGTNSGESTLGDEAAPDPRSASRIRIEIPQVDLEPIETRSLRERSEHAIPDDPRWVLRGAWEQTNLRLNGADFAPGGYDRNLIAIDPEEGVLRTYRVYGDGAYVAAGEFRVEIMPTGTLELRADERRPHLFAAEPFTISGVTVIPPSEPIERPRRWSLRDGVLEIDGRRFVRLEREAFESVARGDAAESPGAAVQGGWEISPASRFDDDPAPAVDFFGTSIVGRHICYVVDVSGSMAGPRLAAALGELARSIESLPSDRFFYVLFFSGSKLVLEDRWLRATPSSKRSFNAKLSGIEAQGGTEPASALEHAFSSLAPVPDEIHFMTDGLIPQGMPELLRNLNAGRVRTVIHTYAFGERASEVMLEAIASEHGGRYRFVPE